MAGARDHFNMLVDRDDLRADLCENRARLLDELGADIYLTGRPVDEAFDLLRRLGGSLSKLPHFLGDNCETLPGVAGSGGLNASVERQEVRLNAISSITPDNLFNLP